MLNIHVADENHNKQTGGGGKTNGLPDLAPKRMFITINVHWQINHSYSRQKNLHICFAVIKNYSNIYAKVNYTIAQNQKRIILEHYRRLELF